MFKDDLMRGLGLPQINVELIDESGQPDDMTFIKNRVLRTIRQYFPCEYVLRFDTPSNGGMQGEGYVDVSQYDFLAVNNVYVIKSKIGTTDVLLPWSTVRIWEQVWLGKSDFQGTDFLLYQNELALLNRVTNSRFSWEFRDGKVYVGNVPSFALGIGVQGLKPIEDLDDLDEGDIVYEYALKLAIAYGKQKLGHIWRKYSVQGVEMPGSEVVAEGKEEEREIMTVIEANSYYPGGLHD